MIDRISAMLQSSANIESMFEYVSCVRITATGFLQTRLLIGGDDMTFYARNLSMPETDLQSYGKIDKIGANERSGHLVTKLAELQ